MEHLQSSALSQERNFDWLNLKSNPLCVVYEPIWLMHEAGGAYVIVVYVAIE